MVVEHPYVPPSERSDPVVEYLIGIRDSKVLQCHLLTVDTSVARAVRTNEGYLAIRGSDRPVCKVIGEGNEHSSLTPLTEAPTAQSGQIAN